MLSKLRFCVCSLSVIYPWPWLPSSGGV